MSRRHWDCSLCCLIVLLGHPVGEQDSCVLHRHQEPQGNVTEPG
jgi:hypothetical protein